jgi:aspartate oxidase
MKIIKTSLLIVGAGMAGLRAAIAARSESPNLDVTVTTTGRMTVCGCSPKTHGVNAAINPDDTIASHIDDTINGGGGINQRGLVEVLCNEIPGEIRWLEEQGVIFDRKDNLFDTGFYGGSTHGRSIHIRDMAGRSIVQTLSNMVIEKGVHIRENRQLLDLIVVDGQCYGAVFFNVEDSLIEVYQATATILATGGGACVYPISTISNDKNASGIIQAYLHGASLIDMEMVQFHPTGLNRPGHSGHGEIMEEELRSMGARLLDRNGRQFMGDYDLRKERATRDIVSRSTFLEIRSGRGTDSGGVVFDLRSVNKKVIANRFPFMLSRLESYGVNLLLDETVEISPAAHFLMGGVAIDDRAETTVRNLFACGEDAGGIHGGNRLGGNGIADALVFGKHSGRNAALSCLTNKSAPKLDVEAIKFLCYSCPSTELESGALRELKQTMWNNSGLVRSEKSLITARSSITAIFAELSPYMQEASIKCCAQEHVRGRVLLQKLLLSSTITAAALARSNSVGSHFREDAIPTKELFNTIANVSDDLVPQISRRKHAEYSSSTPSTPSPLVPLV